MQRRMAAELGITPEQIAELQPLQFYRDEGRVEASALVQLKYRKPTGVRWMDGKGGAYPIQGDYQSPKAAS